MSGQSFGGLSADGIGAMVDRGSGGESIVWLEDGTAGLRTPAGQVLVLVTETGLPPPLSAESDQEIELV